MLPSSALFTVDSLPLVNAMANILNIVTVLCSYLPPMDFDFEFEQIKFFYSHILLIFYPFSENWPLCFPSVQVNLPEP